MGSRGLGQLTCDKRMGILAASLSNKAARESERHVVKTEKGMTRIGAHTPCVKSGQIPAVFDLSKRDTFHLKATLECDTRVD